MKAIDTKRSDFKPDFGYKQLKTKRVLQSEFIIKIFTGLR